ncbi:hypothetical protein [Pseudomonas coronafaciens]|uniref:hypothetical protein n=1 Tax=Pseudomonas coronafaciens TaxID=53409 RepID=UPI000EFE4413|nr:hypothetical protein [Pseudomonas coronafaciens]RMP33875.1 hypothetical protein ALQ25_03745 [Pseudomonas coronafaciens pv. atropurpurea]
MGEPRNFSSKRNRAKRWIAEKGLHLTEVANGRFHISGRGVDLLIADLALLRPHDLLGGSGKAGA